MAKITGVCVGESLVGDGNEVAHVDLLLGPRGSAVETAYCIGLHHPPRLGRAEPNV
jgi:5,6,7,8-tetrahydromethanopterin hydro-lyase